MWREKMYVHRILLKTAIFIGCLFITLALYPFQAIQQNRLYGKVQVSQESAQQGIYVPVHNLKVEVLTVKIETQPDRQQIRTPGEIVKSIHPDSSGYFTFINIREGIYFIRVSMLYVGLNQSRMVDLYQAEIRVQYINQRYGLPTINVPIVLSAQELGLKAENTSKYIGNNKWDWKVYILAPSEVIDNIDCVEYTLHPTFSKPVWKICKDEHFNPRFPFSPPVMQGWGVFNVSIKVFFGDGKICMLDHMLIFE